jgi:hypothetical protein
MKLTEVVTLVRLLRAIAPAQKFDDYTAEAWHPLLDDIRHEDAMAAVKELGKRLPFISPADIRTEVRRLRSERMRHADQSFRHHGDPDDVADYMRQLKDHRAAIADGTVDGAPAIDIVTQPSAEVAALARSKGLPAMSFTPRGMCSCDGMSVSPDCVSRVHRPRGV